MLRYKGAFYPSIPTNPHPAGTHVPVPVPVPRLTAAGAGVDFTDMFELDNIIFFSFLY
jgi:hypothetical protein